MSWLLLLALAQAPQGAPPPGERAGVSGPTYTAQEAQALFTEANDAYYRQEYAVAKEKYGRLLAAGLGGADVLFNLGTTHLAAGELGPAVLMLERARRRSSDDDIEANLAVARQKQVDQVIGAAADAPFLERLADALDPQLVSIAFLGVWYLAFALIFAFRRATPGGRLLLGLAAASSLGLGVLLGGAVVVQAWVSRSVVEGVVMVDTVKAREFPGESAKVSFEVHAGLKVRVMEESNRYVRIRLPNALEAWIEKEGLVEL